MCDPGFGLLALIWREKESNGKQAWNPGVCEEGILSRSGGGGESHWRQETHSLIRSETGSLAGTHLLATDLNVGDQEKYYSYKKTSLKKKRTFGWDLVGFAD